jgi:hypothetical protein
MDDSGEMKNSRFFLFAKQQKFALPYLASCTGSLPAFVSQHAAKKPVRSPRDAATAKVGA